MLKAIGTLRLVRPLIAKSTPILACARANQAKTNSIHTTAKILSGEADFIHRDTPENNANIPFDFTKENYEVVFFFLK